MDWNAITRFAGDRIKDIQEVYSRADEAADDASGGVKQSPLTKTYQQNINNPGYAVKESNVQVKEKVDGNQPTFDSSGNLTSQAEQLITKYAPKEQKFFKIKLSWFSIFGPAYAKSNYAVPGVNHINLGDSQNNLSTLSHEIGHLEGTFRPSRAVGVLGRALTEPTQDIKNLPIIGPALAPIRAVGGLIRAYGDAAEEEYAERFTRKLAGDGAQGFNDNDRSNYGADEYARD